MIGNESVMISQRSRSRYPPPLLPLRSAFRQSRAKCPVSPQF